MRYKFLFLLLIILFHISIYAEEIPKDAVIIHNIDNYSELLDTVDDLKKNIKPENNKYQDKITEVYEKMKAGKPIDVKIPDYNIFSKMQDNVLDIMNLPNKNTLLQQNNDTCIDPEILGDYRVFIFISSSVPKNTLKNYMKDTLKFNDVLLVLNGVIGSADYLKPTQDFITNLACDKELKDLKQSDECSISRVDINPLLFRLFKIDKVPAIVFSKVSYHRLMLASNGAETLSDGDYFIIFGDTSLEYALEKFQNKGADTEKYLKVLTGK